MNNREFAFEMRKKAIDIGYNAGKAGAHFGGGLSCVEILAVLYNGAAKLSNSPDFEMDDHILLSKAHAVLSYYSALFFKGYITQAEIDSFEKNNTLFPGHPLKMPQKGIDYAGGSLGMALSVGAGMALHDKRLNKNNKTFVILGDGECEEGSVWEAAVFASHHKLDNLIAIIDRNILQYDGTTEEISGINNFERIFDSIGWRSIWVDGHNVDELENAFKVDHTGKPFLIVANTVKGKGVSFMENKKEWHHAVLSDEDYIRAKSELVGYRDE